MAVIGVNYDGGNEYDDDYNVIKNNFSYKSVYLHTLKEKFVFNSGNLVKDWYDAKKKYHSISDEEPFFSQSSTCNHFQGDGGKFDSGYLHIVDGKPVLKYVDVSDEHYLATQRHIFEDGWEYFVDEGTQPTWEELKEICK